MGIFNWRKKAQPKHEEPKPVERIKLIPLEFRKNRCEVFVDGDYKGQTVYVKGYGCSCRDSYYFKPQDSKFVFRCKHSSDLKKVIELAVELEIPKRLNAAFQLDFGGSIQHNQSKLNLFVHKLRSEFLLKRIKKTNAKSLMNK